MDLQGVLTAVCALGCVCGGLILVFAFFVLRIVGGEFFGVIRDTIGTIFGFRGSDRAASSGVAESRRIPASQSLRQRAQSLEFDDPLRPPGSTPSGTLQSQSAPPQPRSNFPRTGGFQGQSAPQQPPRGQYPPLQSGGFSPPSYPPPGYPPQQSVYPPQPGYPGPPPQPPAPPGAFPPNYTPPRRPSLSQGRSLSQNPARYSGGLEGDELPGLRNRRARRQDDDYEDDIEAGLIDGLV